MDINNVKEIINLAISDIRKIFYIVKITSHQAQILEKRGISELTKNKFSQQFTKRKYS